MLTHNDDHAQSLGLYQRTARFPVISHETVRIAADDLINFSLDQINVHGETRRLLDAVIDRSLSEMMNLPAASTHHHRTSGGLFYHSLEVGMLSGRSSLEEGECDALVAASFLSGLLHDLGKVWTLFDVFKFDQESATQQFGENHSNTPQWPKTMSLSKWCEENDVKFLGLKYRTKIEAGHATQTRKSWKRVVGQETIDHLKSLPNGESAVSKMANTLNNLYSGESFFDRVMIADHASISREICPDVRWAPKRSDLHLVRRFFEFAALSPWNTPEAPFLYADVLIKGEPTGHTLPFMVSSGDSAGQFRAYLMTEDRYGHFWPDHFYSHMMDTLLHFGLIRADLPFDLPAKLDDTKLGWGPTRRATLRYLDGQRNQVLPLVYCPLNQLDIHKGLPSAVVDLERRPNSRRRLIWGDKSW